MCGAEPRVSRARLFWTFFRIGLLTFGGGVAMVSVMRYELVLRRRWLNEDDFVSVLSTATAVPGAIAVNMAFLQGRRFGGLWGAASAVLGTICPSFMVILLIVWFALPHFEHPTVAVFLKGCAIAVSGQIAFATYTFARRVPRDWHTALACVLGLGILLSGLHPIWAVAGAAGLSYFLQGRGDSSGADDGEEP
jgi:chromate transporter